MSTPVTAISPVAATVTTVENALASSDGALDSIRHVGVVLRGLVDGTHYRDDTPGHLASAQHWMDDAVARLHDALRIAEDAQSQIAALTARHSA